MSINSITRLCALMLLCMIANAQINSAQYEWMYKYS
eukprot:gene1612-12695_t